MIAGADERLLAVRSGLVEIGYDPEGIEFNYEFTAQNGRARIQRADLVAFATTRRHDLETSCIAAQIVRSEEEAAEMAIQFRTLASPIAVFLGPDRAIVQPLGREPDLRRGQRVHYGDLSAYLHSRRSIFEPKSMMTAKRAGLQLDLFTFTPDLVQFAREMTRQLLVTHFEEALRTASELTASGKKRPDIERSLTRMAIRILAAAVLEDQGMLGPGRTREALSLLMRACIRYGDFFDTSDAEVVGWPVADEFTSNLREGVTFRSFSTEDLGHFYEFALSDDEHRRAAGMYYTPSGIAARMLNTIPVEHIHPEERTVLDGTCGSGSLLLAAYRRLSDLIPVDVGGESRHRYLRRHLTGYDRDGFATDVSRLALLLTDLPNGNGWSVTATDFFNVAPPQERYGVIVANPPFNFRRAAVREQQELASRMLLHYLDFLRRDGYLGIVMPASFVSSKSCSQARAEVLRRCQVQELWHLPDGVFAGSSIPTVVVFAQGRHSPEARLVRVSRLADTGPNRRAFELDGGGVTTFVQDSEEWGEGRDRRWLSSPVNSIVSKVEGRRRLRDVAKVANGIIPGKGRAVLSAERRGRDFRPWLDGARRIRPFSVRWSDQRDNRYIQWPDRLQWPRESLRKVFGARNAKVLINANRDPGMPWRISAAVDRVGLFPSQGIHVIYPTSEAVSVEVLAAVLNSSFVNGWLHARTQMLWINEEVVREIPMPSLNAEQERMLSELAREGERSTTESLWNVLDAIDEVVYDAVGLAGEDRALLNGFLRSFPRPGCESPPANVPVSAGSLRASQPVTGRVQAVDRTSRTVTLWLRGITSDKGVRVPVPDMMPGWALEAGVGFEAHASTRHVDERHMAASLVKWRPVDYGYLSDDELDDVLEGSSALRDLYLSGAPS